MRKLTILGAAVIAGAALIALPTPPAAQDAAAAIQTRKDLLKANSESMKAIKAILDNDGALAAIAPLARSVAGNSEKVVAFFPPGSDQGDTKAKAEIWANWPEFQGMWSTLKTRASDLAAAAETGDAAATKKAFGATGGACKACHDKYRL